MLEVWYTTAKSALLDLFSETRRNEPCMKEVDTHITETPRSGTDQTPRSEDQQSSYETDYNPLPSCCEIVKTFIELKVETKKLLRRTRSCPSYFPSTVTTLHGLTVEDSKIREDLPWPMEPTLLISPNNLDDPNDLEAILSKAQNVEDFKITEHPIAVVICRTPSSETSNFLVSDNVQMHSWLNTLPFYSDVSPRCVIEHQETEPTRFHAWIDTIDVAWTSNLLPYDVAKNYIDRWTSSAWNCNLFVLFLHQKRNSKLNSKELKFAYWIGRMFGVPKIELLKRYWNMHDLPSNPNEWQQLQRMIRCCYHILYKPRLNKQIPEDFAIILFVLDSKGIYWIGTNTIRRIPSFAFLQYMHSFTFLPPLLTVRWVGQQWYDFKSASLFNFFLCQWVPHIDRDDFDQSRITIFIES